MFLNTGNNAPVPCGLFDPYWLQGSGPVAAAPEVPVAPAGLSTRKAIAYYGIKAGRKIRRAKGSVSISLTKWKY